MTADRARRRMLTRQEAEGLAEGIAGLLDDLNADLTPMARARWEGALTAVEIILGRAPTVAGVEIGDAVRSIL